MLVASRSSGGISLDLRPRFPDQREAKTPGGTNGDSLRERSKNVYLVLETMFW